MPTRWKAPEKTQRNKDVQLDIRFTKHVVWKFVGDYVLARALGAPQIKQMFAPSEVADVLVNHQLAMAELKFNAQIRRVNEDIMANPEENPGTVITGAEAKYIWLLILAAAREKTRLEKRSSAENNRYIAELTNYAKKHNHLLDAQDKLALWSGGVDLSEYAQDELGYRCLETSKLGGILNQAQLYRNDTRTWDLWDPLAEAFVEQVRRHQEVHVFVRTFDQESTLLQGEYPKLVERLAERANPESAERMFKFHVIVGDTGRTKDMYALTEAGRPEQETKGRQLHFHGLQRAKTALRKYLLETRIEDLIRPEGARLNRPGLMSAENFSRIAGHLGVQRQLS